MIVFIYFFTVLRKLLEIVTFRFIRTFYVRRIDWRNDIIFVIFMCTVIVFKSNSCKTLRRSHKNFYPQTFVFEQSFRRITHVLTLLFSLYILRVNQERPFIRRRITVCAQSVSREFNRRIITVYIRIYIFRDLRFWHCVII